MSVVPESVIIIDDAGTEHEFPAGFDPVKAGLIVRERTAPGTSGTWEDRGIGGKVWRPTSGATERGRVDNAILGMPPELAVLAPIGIGRAIAGAGVSAAGRAVAGAKAVAEHAAPVVKYEATKNALEAIGVPSSLATAAAIAVSGYKRGAKTPTASPAAPVAVKPPAVVDEFTAARTAKQASNALPDQKALNEAALAARRATYQASQQGAPAALPPAGPIVKASGKMQLTAPEMKEFSRLTAKGMKLPDALEQVKAMRELAATLGGATDAQVKAAVAHRAATGAW